MARRKQSELGDIETKDRILASARKHFLAYGFQAAPLRKIASEAGFTSGALYGYFASKEELFYDITDLAADRLMKALGSACDAIEALPEKMRFHTMGEAYYRHIPKIVDAVLQDKDAMVLIVNGSQGTKYEGFLDALASRAAKTIVNASESAESSDMHGIEGRTLEVLMEGYIHTLFRLIVSDRDRNTIIRCMETTGKVYEKGILALMREGTS